MRQTRLESKVSRERYGIEVKKMLTEGKSPYGAFKLICDWG